MLRYKLRTLLIVLAIGPPLLACMWPFLSGGMIVDLRDGGFVLIHPVDGIWVEDKWQLNADWSVSYSRKK